MGEKSLEKLIMKWYPSMRTSSSFLFLLVWLTLPSFNRANIEIGLIDTINDTMRCIGKDREVLLLFKQEIEVNDCGLLSFWDDHHPDCCNWPGINCDKHTGHVIGVHLGCGAPDCYLQGKISSSLSKLDHLKYLDLSCNGFHGEIPHLLANLSSLTSLDLSNNVGPIPNPFGNMSSISYLNLSNNKLQGPIPSSLVNFHSLSHLDLSHNALDGLVPGSIFELDLLEELDLSHNNFEGINFSSNPLGSLCNLRTLSLSNNQMLNDLSTIIETFSQCTNNSLVDLDLSNNSFWGSIPDTIGAFSSLETLDLNSNRLNDTISSNLGQLSMLQELDLSSNSFKATLLNHHFSNLSRLTSLRLSNNPNLVVNIGEHEWVPPFQLREILLSSCNMGPSFPNWIFNQTRFTYLDISSNGISQPIPTSLWNISTSAKFLNLSHNNFYGVLPDHPLNIFVDGLLDLSYNQIEGKIPLFLGYTENLFLNNNKLSGPMDFLCPKNETRLSTINLGDNFLSGELPDCWSKFAQLKEIRLDNNKFVGKAPPSLCGPHHGLRMLSMNNNSLSGELFMLLQNCWSLEVLDLGYNSFTGNIPEGIGNILGSIKILNLRSNKLSGGLPLSLCNLTFVSILDLSFNNFSGTIPKCVCNLQGMIDSGNNMPPLVLFDEGIGNYKYYIITAMIMWKRQEQSFGSNLGRVKYMAFSDNQLEGEIPRGISCLRGLTSLDLARNSLTGSIPDKIGELTSLEFLDLSSNLLSGQIPTSFAGLNFLGVLNVSHNNLSGMIPIGTQLQSMDPTAYAGNLGLCGPPLAECEEDPASGIVPLHGEGGLLREEQEEEGGRDHQIYHLGLYISVVLGFIVGFWGVCGTLVIRKTWRHAYFRAVEDIYDRIHSWF